MAFFTINGIFKKIEVNPIFWRRSYRINQACLQEQNKCVKYNIGGKSNLRFSPLLCGVNKEHFPQKPQKNLNKVLCNTIRRKKTPVRFYPHPDL